MKRNIFLFLLVMIVFSLFFGRLFFPEPKVYYTPDYGASDIWHLNYPLKDFLSRSLKAGELPFWNRDRGTGFPVFAESQIGTLYIFNLVLFKLLPTWLAWNLNYVIAFFICFYGSYLLFVKLKLSGQASLFSAFVFSFGGFFIVHVPHFNLVQAASLMPWVLLAAMNLWSKPSFVNYFWFGIILSQQVFTGHIQTTFITLLGIFVFLISQAREINIDSLVKKIMLFLTAVVFGFAVAAPQVLPMLEYKDLSFRDRGLSSGQIFQYPYHIKYIATFLLPNLFGSARDGTYPNPFETDSGIFWENTGYIGILPIILMLVLLFKKKKRFEEKIFWYLLVFSFLLVLGKSSPLSFVYSFPVFNFFRVPSRFLLLTTFSLAILAGQGLDVVYLFLKRRWKRGVLKIWFYKLALLIVVVDLMVFGYSYNPLVTVSEALKPPEILSVIKEGERIFPLDEQRIAWNSVFFNKGWKDIEPYLYFKNGMDSNLNMIYERPSVLLNSAFATKRAEIQQQLLPLFIDSTGIEYIISSRSLEETDNLKNLLKVESPEETLPDYYVYSYLSSAERFRFAWKYLIVKTPQDLQSSLSKEDFSFEDYVILESDIDEDFEELGVGDVEVVEDKDQKLVLKTNTDKKAILVVADSYYPDWKASINGVETEIIPVNVNQRAVILPSGKNFVEMHYEAESFKRGMVVSLSSVALIVFVGIFKPMQVIKRLFGDNK